MFATLNLSNMDSYAQNSDYLSSTAAVIEDLAIDISVNYMVGYETKLAIFGDHKNLDQFQFYLYSGVDYVISAMGDQSKVNSISATVYRKSGDKWVYVKSELLYGSSRFISIPNALGGSYKVTFTPSMKTGYQRKDSCFYILISFR